MSHAPAPAGTRDRRASTRYARLACAVGAAIVSVALFAYLRDPPWLIGVTSGFGRWETTPAGTRYRSMGGHASFFAPSDARAIEIPVRAVFDTATDWPIVVTITIDDRPADRFTLTDGGWRTVRLLMPPAGGRRVRRIDVRADRTRAGNRALQVGEVRWEGAHTLD